MVETALGKPKVDPKDSTSTIIQQRQHHYWVDKDSFRLNLKRSFSEEAVHEARKSRGLWSCSSHSSEDLLLHQCLTERSWLDQELHSHMESQSRTSSGYSDFGDVFTPLTVTKPSALSPPLWPPWNTRTLSERENVSWRNLRGADPFYYKSTEEFNPISQMRRFLKMVSDLWQICIQTRTGQMCQTYFNPKLSCNRIYRSDLPGRQGMEVYRYPSPLHAVALQSPLYAPQSPQNNSKKIGRRFSGSSTSSLKPGLKVSEHSCCLAKSTNLLKKHINSLGRNMHFEKHRREEIILKRARVQSHSHSTAPRDEAWPHVQREPCTAPAPYTKANHPSIIFSPRTPRICGETEKMCVSTASTMQAMKGI